MKKMKIIMIYFSLLLLLLMGCGGSSGEKTAAKNEEKEVIDLKEFYGNLGKDKTSKENKDTEENRKYDKYKKEIDEEVTRYLEEAYKYMKGDPEIKDPKYSLLYESKPYDIYFKSKQNKYISINIKVKVWRPVLMKRPGPNSLIIEILTDKGNRLNAKLIRNEKGVGIVWSYCFEDYIYIYNLNEIRPGRLKAIHIYHINNELDIRYAGVYVGPEHGRENEAFNSIKENDRNFILKKCGILKEKTTVKEDKEKGKFEEEVVDRVLKLISLRKIKDIDKLPVEHRQILKDYFNTYFSKVTGYSLLPVKEENEKYFDKKVHKAVEATSNLFRGKKAEILIDFYGKPTDVQWEGGRKIAILYRTSVNGGCTFMIDKNNIITRMLFNQIYYNSGKMLD